MVQSVDGTRHVADIKTDTGLVVEFQHSHLSTVERRERESFYGNLIWVVDGTRLKRDLDFFAQIVNQGVAHLMDGQIPPRRGNDHPTIVPYGTFPALDGTFILAIGNDNQFARFVTEAGAPGLATDARFATNAARVRNRDVLIPLIAALTAGRASADWLAACDRLGVPAGAVNDLAQVFASPQVAARGMRIRLGDAHGAVDLIGNPLKMSETPVTYAKPPPALGEDSGLVLGRLLGLSAQQLAGLAAAGVIEGARTE